MRDNYPGYENRKESQVDTKDDKHGMINFDTDSDGTIGCEVV